MDNMYQPASSDTQPPPVYSGGYSANRAPPSSTQPGHTAPPWTPSQGYDAHPYGFRCDFPAPSHGGGSFGGPGLALPYGFDPSVPPPPFGCPPPGHFPNMVPSAPVNIYSSRGAFPQQLRPCPQATGYAPDCSQKQQHQYEDFSASGARFPPQGKDDRIPEDETVLQRRQDQQWLGRFLQDREHNSKSLQARHKTPHSSAPELRAAPCSSVPELRAALYGAAHIVSQLAESCETLRNNVENECVWANSYLKALQVKRELQDRLAVLGASECLESWKTKVSRVAKRRARRRRARRELQMEQTQREERIADKEAAINTWRMQQIRLVEERKKELELKLAADSVLCEVRKKQADVKRMQEVLRSLEKLRRLRKEAASRKGIVTERSCDEAFSSRLQQLSGVMKRRTAVYSAEEKALMVMLEGEQEEERRREQEKRGKKERERQLQRKRRADAMLFGDELPADSVLQPFRQYYTEAEHSLHALLHIRRQWDAFVVPADHPDGSPVPQGWVLPEAPSDQAWASALHTAHSE
ncbi:programmed cell death protein 7 [Sander lucioperca]|uniref:Programmed cell death 7 n=1 Tax=Sander lucioperca TaxID=283035 RepID=A0A8C9YYZ5_SANLU|nr:programmed cell death protein 7 [Sander lucioperca]XP_031142717.1 programmed cell death protein 7 [Sander lucioperca]XP_031142725.1 programmed cell death protein 7 [Sander lucioperca]